jgi:prolyl-tRNA synthetase
MEAVDRVASMLRSEQVRVHIDAREGMTPGAKFYEWERKGVPLRIEIGPRDVAQEQLVLVLRSAIGDQPRKEALKENAARAEVRRRLNAYQRALLDAARSRREENSHRGITDYARMREIIEESGGFVYAGWCGNAACEEKVKAETRATIRVLPFEEFRSPEPPTACIVCGGAVAAEAMWARAY